jgi:hypothetical protein
MAECTFSRGETRRKENTEMMPRLAGIALILFLVSPAYAQQPTPLEIAVMTCIAPGFIPDSDPFDLFASLPEKHCIRACRASAKGCKDLVKTIDRCGVSFLKAAVKTSIEICRGLGGTLRECRAIRDIAKPDIDWWRVEGKLEKAACDTDVQTLCLSRCQSTAPVPFTDLILPPLPVLPGIGDGGAGDLIMYLEFPNPPLITPIPVLPSLILPVEGVRLQAVDVVSYIDLIPALPRELPEIDSGEQAGGAIVYLQIPSSPLPTPIP